MVEDYKAVQETSKIITSILEDPGLAEQISNSRDYRQLVEYLVKTHEVSHCFFTVETYEEENFLHRK